MNKYARKSKDKHESKVAYKAVQEQKQGGGHHTGAKLTRIIRHTDNKAHGLNKAQKNKARRQYSTQKIKHGDNNACK